MLIAIGGKYSAPTQQERDDNLAVMEKVAMEAAGKPIYFSVETLPDHNSFDTEL